MLRITAVLIAIPVIGLAMLAGCSMDSPAAPQAETQFEATAAFAPNANASPSGDHLVRSTWPTDDDPGMPFYTRIEPVPPHVYMDSGWAVVPFYRDPGCVPGGFNLLQFFDFEAFGCPHTVHGHSLWHGAVGAGSPQLVVAQGSSVPMWFVPEEAMMEAMADGILTLGEIEALPGLVKGAGFFHETHQPHPLPPEMGGGGHRIPKMVIDARGTLEDGRRYSFHLTRADDLVRSIRIRIR
jgi:hypothetical protein